MVLAKELTANLANLPLSSYLEAAPLMTIDDQFLVGLYTVQSTGEEISTWKSSSSVAYTWLVWSFETSGILSCVRIHKQNE